MTTKSRETEIRMPTMFYANPTGSKSEVAECCLVSDVGLMREKCQMIISDLEKKLEESSYILAKVQKRHDFQTKRVEKLQELSACMYQFAGAHDAPEVWLDALSEAADGRAFSTEKLLPYIPATADQKTEALTEIDRLAEGGLCQYSSGGKHAFLQDIRRVIADLGIQGGITEFEK